MIKYLITICILFFTKISYAEPLDFREVLAEKKVEYLRFKYEPKQIENLEFIYKSFTKDSYQYNSEDPMVFKTKSYNKNVKDWNSLKTDIKLYVDIEVLDLAKLLNYNKALKGEAQALLKKLKEQKRSQRFRGSVFYMASKGTFDQENSSGVVNFEQNSSFSLGGSFSYYPENPKISFSSSLYYSHLNTANSSLFVDEVSVDAEIGGNIYGEYKLNSPRMSVYTGLDFEKFNTFNIEGLQNSTIKFDTNKVVYLTAGVGKSFYLFKKKFFSKLSFSTSIVSSRTIGLTGATNTEDFSGSKVLLYLFKSINKKFFVHSLFKYHWMSGPSELKVKRLGIGFGYIF